MQKELKQTAPKKSSYISALWYDMYLASRKPLVLHYNPYIGFLDDPDPLQNYQVGLCLFYILLILVQCTVLFLVRLYSYIFLIPTHLQTLRATNLIVSAMRFKRSLEEEVLTPELYHLNPLVTDNTAWKHRMRLIQKFI